MPEPSEAEVSVAEELWQECKGNGEGKQEQTVEDFLKACQGQGGILEKIADWATGQNKGEIYREMEADVATHAHGSSAAPTPASVEEEGRLVQHNAMKLGDARTDTMYMLNACVLM